MEVSVPPPPKPVLMDIRDWSEDVDGIPGWRIRNCIIFQLDYANNPFYHEKLSESYVRHKAHKIHADTPTLLETAYPAGGVDLPLLQARRDRGQHQGGDLPRWCDAKGFTHAET